MREDNPVDLLASVYRSAIARRSPDALQAINQAIGSVIELDPRELTILATVDDGGRRPNRLWSRWISHGRTLELAEPPQRGAPSKALPPQKKQ